MRKWLFILPILALSGSCHPALAEDTKALREALEKEYSETIAQIQQLQAHALEIQGAIKILVQLEQPKEKKKTDAKKR